MKHIKKSNRSFRIFFISFLAMTLLLAGCQPLEPTPESPQSVEPEATIVEQNSPTTEPSTESKPEILVDFSGIAKDGQIDLIPAVTPNDASPYWEILPEHRILTLEGYPVAEHLLKPQIFVYPLAELASFNEGANQIALDLEKLLNDENVGEHLPFLPLFNAAQVMHAQVEFIQFKNGQGVRYLTQFDQAPIPLNNYELIYTFQGITSDGKYYVSAVLPVTHPDLPENNQISLEQEFVVEKFMNEMAESIQKLEGYSMDSFQPSLSQLDALIQSIEVK